MVSPCACDHQGVRSHQVTPFPGLSFAQVDAAEQPAPRVTTEPTRAGTECGRTWRTLSPGGAARTPSQPVLEEGRGPAGGLGVGREAGQHPRPTT